MKLPILFLIVIAGASISGGFVFVGLHVSTQVMEAFDMEPKILVLKGEKNLWEEPELNTTESWSVSPNSTMWLLYQTFTRDAREFRVEIIRFSEELRISRSWPGGYLKPTETPYELFRTRRAWYEQPLYWGLEVTAPSQLGRYEIIIRMTVSTLIFSKQSYHTIVIIVEEPPSKPPTIDPVIALDKEIYHQGDTLTMTIKNISNETLWFTDAIYNLVFERFDYTFNDFVFHTAPVATQVMTPLEPEKSVQITWKLDAETFPPGRYQVNIKGVRVEFRVV